MVHNDRWVYIGGDASNHVAFRYCLRICSDMLDLVYVCFLQRFFRGWCWRRASRSSLANHLISNESMKSDTVQIVAKNYPRLHQTEIRSVWLNVTSMTGHPWQVDSLLTNSKQTASTLSFSPGSILLMTVKSTPNGTSSMRQSELEMVWHLLCAANYKRHDDHPLTFLVRMPVIDGAIA